MSNTHREPPQRYARRPADLPVRITTIEPDLDPLTGRSYFRASWERCENISRGGAFIQTLELLDPGRRVLLELSLPDGGQIEAIGRVAWTRREIRGGSGAPHTGLGVEFLGGAAEVLNRLAAFADDSDPDGIDH